jgi:hypothetical protein
MFGQDFVEYLLFRPLYSTGLSIETTKHSSVTEMVCDRILQTARELSCERLKDNVCGPAWFVVMRFIDLVCDYSVILYCLDCPPNSFGPEKPFLASVSATFRLDPVYCTAVEI